MEQPNDCLHPSEDYYREPKLRVPGRLEVSSSVHVEGCDDTSSRTANSKKLEANMGLKAFVR